MSPGDKSRRTEILEASMRVFFRHGYGKTTMADLAKEAGVSRPTVYLHFRNKEDLFREGAKGHFRKKLLHVEARLAKARKQLGDQIWCLFDAWFLESFIFLEQAVDSRELVLRGNTICGDIIDEAHEKLEDLVTKILSDHGKKPARELARLLVVSGRGMVEFGHDLDDLTEMLKALKKTVERL